MFFARRRLVIAALIAVCAIGTAFLVPHFSNAQTDDVGARRAALQAQLNDLESQISAANSKISNLQGQGQSLQRDIGILDGQIAKTKLQIQATDVSLQALAQNITLQSNSINYLTGRIDQQKSALAQILRQTQQIDDYSLVEVAFSTQDVSSFFGDLDSFTSLKTAIGASSRQLSSTRDSAEKEKDELVTQKTQTEQLKALKVQQENQVKQQQAQKQQLLAQNRGETAKVQGSKATLEKTAAQVRAELFALAGGGGAIPLPVAIADAQIASKATGVRAALILGILSQESALGKNVGQCYVTDLTTGDGKGKNTGTFFGGVMKAPRDTTVFKRLMDALGRDWSTTAVSCPQPGGYGGAMGPTQFIPSTWAVYEPRIKSKLGVGATDPWNPLHAIMATGIYLSDVGGAGGDEHTAAAKYYAGGNWASAGQAYANSVMDKAAQFQVDIDALAGH